jgi:putative ABC transport system substrate-binding protein
MIERRRMTLVAGALASAFPFAVRAQPKSKLWRIGFLGAADPFGYAAQLQGFRQGLRDFGYVEGKNVVVDFRWAEGRYERLPELANELVQAKVDVIVTHGTPGTRAAKQATQTIPIVMAIVGDALATGIVASIARPGGNITGSSFFNPELAAKRIELIKESMPSLTQVAVLVNPDNPSFTPMVKLMEATAKALKVELLHFPVRALKEFEEAFAVMAAKRLRAVAVLEDALFNTNIDTLVTLATRHRMFSAGGRELADAGGALGYGVNFPEIFRRAAYFIDRIIKGAKPGDLPVEQPTRFELAINVKAAKAIGVTFPPTIVVRAERVIE